MRARAAPVCQWAPAPATRSVSPLPLPSAAPTRCPPPSSPPAPPPPSPSSTPAPIARRAPAAGAPHTARIAVAGHVRPPAAGPRPPLLAPPPLTLLSLSPPPQDLRWLSPPLPACAWLPRPSHAHQVPHTHTHVPPLMRPPLYPPPPLPLAPTPPSTPPHRTPSHQQHPSSKQQAAAAHLASSALHPPTPGGQGDEDARALAPTCVMLRALPRRGKTGGDRWQPAHIDRTPPSLLHAAWRSAEPPIAHLPPPPLPPACTSRPPSRAALVAPPPPSSFGSTRRSPSHGHRRSSPRADGVAGGTPALPRKVSRGCGLCRHAARWVQGGWEGRGEGVGGPDGDAGILGERSPAIRVRPPLPQTQG